MLNMLPTNDRKLLDSMSFKIFSSPFEGDIGYMFYEDDKPIGFAKLVVGDTSNYIHDRNFARLQRKRIR